MNAIRATPQQEPRHGPSSLRAILPGAVVTLVVVGVLIVTGVLGDLAVWSAVGGAVAVLAGWFAGVQHARMAARPARDSAVVEGALVSRALALGFLIKLAALGFGTGVLVLAGLKFPQVAAFALAFAAASLVCQACSALGLARQMARQGRPVAGRGSPGSS